MTPVEREAAAKIEPVRSELDAIGHPIADLRPFAEGLESAVYGSAPTGFFEGYERYRQVAAADAREFVYRLDTAVMLEVVFLSEAPDPNQAEPRVARVRELLRALNRALGR
jgi:hypothetical protein